MNLETFVRAARVGAVQRGGGGLDAAGRLVDGVAVLEATDAEAIAAEAYNQGVVDPEAAWDAVLADVRALLREPQAAFDPTLHPRHDKGVREGGRFREKDAADAGTPPVLAGLTEADYAANAARIVRTNRKHYELVGFSDKPFDEALAAEEAKLREEPLVHATSAEAAAMIWQDDGELRSRAAMQGDITEAEDELRSLIADVAGSVDTDPNVPLSAVLEDFAGYAKRHPDEIDDTVLAQVRGLTKVVEGTTFPEDVKLGFDRFVFFHHGRTSPEYGTTEILVDNGTLTREGWFATPRDIVLYAKDAGPGGLVVTGDPAKDEEPGHAYAPNVVQEYRREIVTGDGYWKAAAAHRVTEGLARRYAGAQASFEVKLPTRVDRKRIVGFIAGTLEDYDTLKGAGIHEDRIYYLPIDSRNYTARFRMVARHAQLRGEFTTFPKYDELPDGTEDER